MIKILRPGFGIPQLWDTAFIHFCHFLSQFFPSGLTSLRIESSAGSKKSRAQQKRKSWGPSCKAWNDFWTGAFQRFSSKRFMARSERLVMISDGSVLDWKSLNVQCLNSAPVPPFQLCTSNSRHILGAVHRGSRQWWVQDHIQLYMALTAERNCRKGWDASYPIDCSNSFRWFESIHDRPETMPPPPTTPLSEVCRKRAHSSHYSTGLQQHSK